MRVNLWIRKEDEAIWNAIEGKPDWLHDRIREFAFLVEKTPYPVKPFGIKLDMCKHGAARGNCKKGC